MLTKLKNLDLSSNPLEDLPPDVFKDVIVSMTARVHTKKEVKLYIRQLKMVLEMMAGVGDDH
jgi:Leucine-rich repeat (LRR) protein